MKQLLLVSAAAAVISTGSVAHAADLPVKPPYSPVAAYSWTGCYLGVQVGGGILSDYAFSDNGAGAIGGGQLGCNYQTGSLVFGVEGEGWASSIRATDIDGEAASNRWTADLAFRGGVSVDGTLVYGKFGVAVAEFDYASSNTLGNFLRNDETLTGVLVGAGLEYPISPRLSAKVEYEHIGYIGKVVHTDASGIGFNVPFDETTSASTHVVKAGINYRFGGPWQSGSAAPSGSAGTAIYKASPAAYSWTGCYAGLHAGGGLQYNTFTQVNTGGAVAGGQLGCNYQIHELVLGVEAESWWSGVDSRRQYSSTQLIPTSTHNPWDADIALRAGVAVDRALLYYKAGGAFGRFDFRDVVVTPGIVTGFDNGSGSLNGILLGAGIEYALDGRWSAKLEYNHIDFAGRDLHFVSGPPAGDPSHRQTASATEDIYKAGVNYKFAGVSGPDTAPASGATAGGHNWTGCYQGLHGGGGTLFDRNFTGENGDGAFGGIQGGCNYQWRQAVVGLEGEGWWSGMRSKMLFANDPGSVTNTYTDRNPWGADVAARFGVAVGQSLLYAKAGEAWSRFNFQRTETDVFGGGATFTITASGKTTFTGLLLGSGLEYALSPNWSAKLEYNYLGFGGSTVHFEGNSVFDRSNTTLSATQHIVKMGVNYQFGSPM
jgi:opacity protein-like surface antigen